MWAEHDQIKTCSSEHEVFEVHQQLQDVSGVLVVDDHAKLIRIITGYDTTEYLRQRVQAIVFVQDIEERIKDDLRLAFRNADGSDDDAALATAVAEVSKAGHDQLKTRRQVLHAYLALRAGQGTVIDTAAFQQAFQQQTAQRKPAAFEHLTLAQHIQRLLKYGMAALRARVSTRS